jgi:hypothetical protein
MKLISTPARGFLAGFLCAILLVGAVELVAHSAFVGGQGADSPDGRYRVSVIAAINPAARGPYVVELEDCSSGIVLRRLEIHLSSDEKGEPLRGGPRVTEWSPKSDYADIRIGEKPVMRVFVP